MKLTLKRNLPLAASIIASLMFVSAPPVISAEPANEDEWYDPSDWFDGNNYEYDDTLGATRGAEWRNWNKWNDWDTWDHAGYGWDGYDYDDYSYGGTYPYWRDTYDYNADTNRQNQRTTANRSRSVAGTVEGFREVNVRDRAGKRDQFTVARIKLRDGRSVTVDLGRRLSLQDLHLNKGDYISVTGKSRAIGGQNVMLADYIYADGEQHRIMRTNTGQTSRSTAQNQTSQDVWNDDRNRATINQTLRGTVESFRRVNLQGAEDDHTLARLTMENGRTMIVDFGPRQTPASLGINQGDYVSVRGTQKKIDDRPILQAQSVYADGSWRNVPRSGSSESNQSRTNN